MWVSIWKQQRVKKHGDLTMRYLKVIAIKLELDEREDELHLQQMFFLRQWWNFSAVAWVTSLEELTFRKEFKDIIL